MADEEQSFVTRRGKRVSLHNLNVDDLHIDDIPGQQPEHITTPRAAPPREPRHIPWKWILPIVLLAIAAPVLSGEYITREYATSGDITRQRFANLVSQSVTPQQLKTDLNAAQIVEITEKINHLSSHMCKGGMLDNIASLYPRAARAHKQCIGEQEKYSALILALRAYAAERDYLEKLHATVKPLSETPPERFAVISSQLEMWRAAEDAMKKLSPTASLKSVQDNMYKYTYAIMEDWSKLNTAYNEKKGDEFVAIQKKMRDDYGSLQANGNNITSVINASQTKVTNAYSAIKH